MAPFVRPGRAATGETVIARLLCRRARKRLEIGAVGRSLEDPKPDAYRD